MGERILVQWASSRPARACGLARVVFFALLLSKTTSFWGRISFFLLREIERAVDVGLPAAGP